MYRNNYSFFELERRGKLSDETYRDLTELGKKNETYDDIVKRLIDSYKKSLKK